MVYGVNMKLYEVSEEVLLEIECSCVGFFLSYKRTPKYRPQHKELLEVVGGARYEKELWVVITCATQAMSKGSTLSKFPFGKKYYNEQSKRYNIKLSYPKIKHVIQTLSVAGYLQVYTGYNNPRDTTKSKMSVIRFHKMFTILFDGIDLTKYTHSKSGNNLVEVRSEDNKEDLISTKGVGGVLLMKKDITRLNDVLASVDVKLFKYKCVVEYTRIFIEDIKSSGRYYSGVFQTIPSKYRECITFDDEPTVEIDISSIHPSILACKMGIVLPDSYKPYHCYYPITGETEEVRGFCKKAVMCILYSDSIEVAEKAIYDFHRKDQLDHKSSKRKKPKVKKYGSVQLKRFEYRKVIDSIIENNDMISKYFFSGDLWKELQYIDSEICRYVINYFTNLGKPILPYHDSWRVAESDQGLLEKVIPEAWYSVLGTYDNLKFDVK